MTKLKTISNNSYKWALRIIAGFLGLLLMFFILFHTPPIQNLVTTKATQYLSNKIGSHVSLDAIQINFWGGLTVKGITINDPENVTVFTTERFHFSPNLWSLLLGQISIASVELEGSELDLQKQGENLNIDFIIEAFSNDGSGQQQEPSTLKIQVSRFLVHDVAVKYQDLAENSGFQARIESFEMADFKLSTQPKVIELAEIDLADSYFLLIYAGEQAKNNSAKLPPLDFNSGFTIKVNEIHLTNNHLEFHKEQQLTPAAFDGNHLVFDSTNLEISDLVVSPEQLSSRLNQLATNFSELQLHQATADIQISRRELNLSNLLIDFEQSQLHSEMQATYESWENLISEFKSATLNLDFEGSIDPDNLTEFLPAEISDRLNNLPISQVMLSGQSEPSGITIDTASVSTGSDLLSLNSKLSHYNGIDSLNWTDLQVTGTIGNIFSNLLTQLSTEIIIPVGTAFEVQSDGSISRFNLNSSIDSPVGKLFATGTIHGSNLDLAVTTEKFNIGSVIKQQWLGSTDLALMIKGNSRKKPGLSIRGDINEVNISQQKVEQINLDALFFEESLEIDAAINDQNYLSEISAAVEFADTLEITSNIDFDNCLVGDFVGIAGLQISGNMKSNVALDAPSINTHLSLSSFEISQDTVTHLLDSLQLDLQISENKSQIKIESSELSGELLANFNLQQEPFNFKKIFTSYGPGKTAPSGDRKLDFNLLVEDVRPIQIIDPRFENFEDLRLYGHLDESESTLELNVNTKDFQGFGLSIDSIGAHFLEDKQLINSDIALDNIEYSNIPIGNLALNIFEREENIYSKLLLVHDSIQVISLTSLIESMATGVQIRLDSLISFDQSLEIDPLNVIQIDKDGVQIENFTAGAGEFRMEAEGDFEGYHLKIVNGELQNLNYLLSSDSSTIDQGLINTDVSYLENILSLDFGIDGLIIGNTPPLSITATAKTEDNVVPFEFKLNSESNQAGLSGSFYPMNSGIEAELALNIKELEMFQLLFRDRLEKIRGRVDGVTKITGTVHQPIYHGALRFRDVDFTTSRPVSSFYLKDETLKLDNQGIVLDEFTIYDQWDNPLSLDGVLRTQDYRSFDYDFTLFTENYLLLNNPADDEYRLQGTLVVGSNLKFKGNEKDTHIDAEIIIRDTTALSYILPEQDLELLSNEGIVEFVDPNNPTDTLEMVKSEHFYDSVMAALPSFNLKSKVVLEEEAVFRVVVNPRSGDFIEVAGTANLNFDVDRTRNIKLNGNYQVTRGFYQLSFYDLVKKRFEITEGSSITWDGNPDTGTLDIKAINNINSSSIGLIGHEIGESERELYRTALPYEVGIIIKGTIEQPQIRFSLELPQDEKTKYPVLANKLERLTQPEFESELNKQVFGLLVLGGFIPDDSGSDLDQSLIATTAISNSVNSILASQLNRFAGQLIKGVDINVGLQSYSDYTSGGSQTRTAMDFRVTKRMMDERLSIEVGGGMDINSDQSGSNPGSDNFRGDITVIYDLTESGTKKLKLFNNETYDIIYHEIRNTGISLIFIKDFDKGEKAVN